METIDAHHHLWQYTPTEYGWIDEKRALQRDFLPADLLKEVAAAGVGGTIVIQARQTMEETRWLLQQAEDCEAICGVVGWAPIAGEEFPACMEEFEHRPKLKGLRHVIQGERDPDYILREDFNSGIRCLRGSGLVYEILVHARQLPQAIAFVDSHPEQAFVLDHAARPMMEEGLEPWATQMRELGRRDHVWCKLSGMVLEAEGKTWDEAILKPYLDVAVEAFGPDRLMAGSNWPVCLLTTGYAEWFEVLQRHLAPLTARERTSIFAQNARTVYGLGEG